jgi:NADH dehydrogenase FAD-containing subunit
MALCRMNTVVVIGGGMGKVSIATGMRHRVGLLDHDVDAGIDGR